MTLILDDQTGALPRYTDIDLVVTCHVSQVDAAGHWAIASGCRASVLKMGRFREACTR